MFGRASGRRHSPRVALRLTARSAAPRTTDQVAGIARRARRHPHPVSAPTGLDADASAGAPPAPLASFDPPVPAPVDDAWPVGAPPAPPDPVVPASVPPPNS